MHARGDDRDAQAANVVARRSHRMCGRDVLPGRREHLGDCALDRAYRDGHRAAPLPYLIARTGDLRHHSPDDARQ